MIDRFDVSYSLTGFDLGRYVLYEDHLAELAALKTKNKRLEESLIYYVKESYKVET